MLRTAIRFVPMCGSLSPDCAPFLCPEPEAEMVCCRLTVPYSAISSCGTKAVDSCGDRTVRSRLQAEGTPGIGGVVDVCLS